MVFSKKYIFLIRENTAELKMGLSSLPTPKNDYEIVVPEDGDDAVEMQVRFLSFFS